MKKALYIIVDVSGSMNEMGKIHIQRNLLRYVSQLHRLEQEKYSSDKIYFYHWAQNISEIIFQGNEDIPILKAEGSSSLSDLSDFLTKKIKDTEVSRVLIFSDGNFPNSEIVAFQKKFNMFGDLVIRTVAVGADADLLKLKKTSTNNEVYLSENIATAIESTIFGSDELLAAPISTAQILQFVPVEAEELDENWDV